MIKLRPATISDAEAVVRVHFAAVHGPGPSTFYTQDIRQSWSPSPTDECAINRFHQTIQSKEKLLVVAELIENAVIVGFGSVTPSKKEIGAVYVDPAFSHQRIGSKILAHLEEFALVQGTNKLYLDASLNAENFYCHHGYSVLEHTSHRLHSGVMIDCVKMSKELHANH